MLNMTSPCMSLHSFGEALLTSAVPESKHSQLKKALCQSCRLARPVRQTWGSMSSARVPSRSPYKQCNDSARSHLIDP